MNKRNFAKIYMETSKRDITLKQAIQEINLFLETVKEVLIKDGKVKFVGKGTFEILERKPRIIANPVTKELMKIYPKKSIKFTPSKKLTKEKAD